MKKESRRLFPKTEIPKLVKAMEAFEKKTSGEIRIHVEERCEGDPMARAVRVFNALRLYRTKARNCVLIYVAAASRKLAIIGDTGINRKVPEGFWEDLITPLQASFAEGTHIEGLCKTVEVIGRRMARYFPYSDDDVNEIPDEVSFGEDTE